MAAIIVSYPDRQVRSTEPPPSADPVVARHRRDAEVYRRRRLVVAAVLVGLVLGMISVGRQAGASRPPDADADESVSYVVQPGDTLWAIARRLSPGQDPRPLVAALDDVAGGAVLQPGQALVIPGELVD